MEGNCQEEDGGGTAKRIKLSVDDELIEVVAQPPQVGPGLLDLSDDVLLIIFAYLSPADLINLSQSCARLWNVTRDRTLWAHVDCRENLLDAEVFEETYLDYLLPGTKFLAVDFRLKTHRKKGRKLRADARSQGGLTLDLLKQITSMCIRLDTLILQDVCFDAQQIPFGRFPSTLTHLSLKNSDVQNLPVRVSYFNDIHRIMPNIQVLVLSHSLWLESHSLMAISKCVKLKELRLQGCYALGDCIAYFSIATRFGFKDLETLDLRGTQVGDPEVSCLNLVPSLRHLYLESITQYARRRDAEYYMNRVRQYPDITIVPHPDAGPVQNPVILLQRIDGEMVARNVTSEFHSFGRPRGINPPPAHSHLRPGATSSPGSPPVAHARLRASSDEPSTSRGARTPAPSAFMRRLRERWQIPDRRFCGTSRSRPVVVVPMKRPRVPTSSDGPGPANPPNTFEQFNALEDALRLRGVITLIHDNIFSSCSGSRPNSATNVAAGLVNRGGSSSAVAGIAANRPGPPGVSSSVDAIVDETRNISKSEKSSPTQSTEDEAGPSSAQETRDCAQASGGNKTNEESHRYKEGCVANSTEQSLCTNGESGGANDQSKVTDGMPRGCRTKSDTDGKSLLREVKVEEGRVVVHISNNINDAALDGENAARSSSEETKRYDNCDGVGLAVCSRFMNRLTGGRSSSANVEPNGNAVDGADGSRAGNSNCRRFKRPFKHNSNSKACPKPNPQYESDEESDPCDVPVPLVTIDPLIDYREYLTRYIREDNSSRRMQELKDDDDDNSNFMESKEGGDDSRDGLPNKYPTQASDNNSPGENKVNNFSIDNGPCCSYLPKERTALHVATPAPLDCSTSMPSCSKYDPQQQNPTDETPSDPSDGPSCSKGDAKRRKFPSLQRPRIGTAERRSVYASLFAPKPDDEGDHSSEGDVSPDCGATLATDSETDDPSGSEDDRPPAAGSPLHFCTIGRARFSGLTVPFFHRVPQVTDSCIHAMCSGKSHVRPQPGYDIMTLRASPKEPVHECRLETLVLRHFPKINDQSLYVLSKLMSLRVLDVTGTSVTACGVKNFRLMRPDVQVSSDHDNPVEP